MYKQIFQSTRPSRASTPALILPVYPQVISIHKALAGLDERLTGFAGQTVISIHKALAGLDMGLITWAKKVIDFNPQGPRGPRPILYCQMDGRLEFQSTRPSRASTWCKTLYGFRSRYFNPQGPRGPRHFLDVFHQHNGRFQSTRPSRASTKEKTYAEMTIEFQSTRPSRASTFWGCIVHTGCQNFNPQGPRGPRLTDDEFLFQLQSFQSTRPSRASTWDNRRKVMIDRFQSTRPSRASTRVSFNSIHISSFQSTRPSRAST